MPGSIQLPEAIGKNASPRHADPENLTRTLASPNASEGLLRAAATLHNGHLAQEPGCRSMQTPNHVNQTVPDEEQFIPGHGGGGGNDGAGPIQDATSESTAS